MSIQLTTSRLLLRPWSEEDKEPFAAINADPAVMEHYPAVLSRQESDALADRFSGILENRGFGFWAVEEKASGKFIGFIGLAIADFKAHFTPCTEIGWRLARSAWGQGLAPEGAKEALRYAFQDLHNDEVVSFTTVGNKNSMRVMEKIGMSRDPRDDFIQTRLPAGHPLAPHVLYRLSKSTWQKQNE